MEPKLPSPNRGSEILPSTYSKGVEHTLSIPTPEKSHEGKHERVEQSTENASTMPAQPILPPPISAPLPPAQTTEDSSVQASTPLAAADEDLIEKEWVDKAKAIIVETKDDPYLREKEVSKLQADYLRKRYGKELGAS
jgi:hypothetical protein